MDHDIDDEQVQALQEALVTEGLRRARAQETGPFAVTGLCANCKEPIDVGRFCDADCRTDWEKQQRAAKFRRV